MFVTLRINSGCNFACTYCFDHLQRHPHFNQMSLHTSDKILRFLLHHHIDSISIPQQEPTLSPSLLKHIIKTYARAGIHTSGITTNGYALTSELIEVFKEHNVGLLVSYDGIWHDEYRKLKNGDKTEEVVRENIYKLKDAGIRFGIATSIFHGVTEKIIMNYEYLKTVVQGVSWNFDVSSPYAVQREDLANIREGFRHIAREGLSHFPLNRINERLKSGSKYTNRMCGAGRGSYTINWDGRIFPCYHVLSWEEMSICLGDIDAGIDEVERRKFNEYDTAKPDKCNKCNSALCGICYTASHDATGNMLMPIPINCMVFNELTKIVQEVIE